MSDQTYRIVRFYQNDSDPLHRTVLGTGLTLAEAQAHCRDDQTSSRTATRPELVEHTAKHGPWFDGFEKE